MPIISPAWKLVRRLLQGSLKFKKLVVAYLKEHQSEHTVEAISAGIKCSDDIETVYLTLEKSC
jgi:hypothetical protein